jgi:hypothetical protein
MLAKLRGAYVPVLGTLQPKKHAAVLLRSYAGSSGTV